MGCQHGNCEIRTSKLAQFADDTIFWAHNSRLLFAVQFENLLGAELDTYPAALAPITIYFYLFEFLPRHIV